MNASFKTSFSLVALFCLAAGASHAADRLLTVPGNFADEGDALEPSVFDFDGDGHADICSEAGPEGSPFTTIRVLGLDGTELWSRTFDVRDFCPVCTHGTFNLEGFAEIEALAGKEAILQWSGASDEPWQEELAVLVWSPSSDQATVSFDSAYVEWIGDFNGDGWDEIVIEYLGETVDSFQVWGHGSTIGIGDAGPAASRTKVEPNRPNPFNPETTIRFELSTRSRVTVEIHSVDGRLVRSLDMADLQPGPHEVRWDGLADSGLRAGSGAYFYSVVAGGDRIVRKMILLR